MNNRHRGGPTRARPWSEGIEVLAELMNNPKATASARAMAAMTDDELARIAAGDQLLPLPSNRSIPRRLFDRRDGALAPRVAS